MSTLLPDVAGDYKIVIDVREHALEKALAERGTPHESSALPLGDILVSSADGSTHVLVERKTCSDMLASVIDGRYAEQKGRMFAWMEEQGPARAKVVYIVETMDKWSLGDDKVVTGCVMNTVLRDGIPVFIVRNVNETCIAIEEIAKRVKSYNVSSNKSVPNLPSKKKGRVHDGPKGVLLRQLCEIDGISMKKAESLVDAMHVDTMAAFVTKLQSDEAEPQAPGIGKKLREAIRTSLLG